MARDLVSWRESAACRGEDPNVFFQSYYQPALSICARCDVRRECLEARLAEVLPNELDMGVWGGMTPAQRAAERRRRRRFARGV